MQDIITKSVIQKLEHYIIQYGVNLDITEVLKIIAPMWPKQKLVLFSHQLTGIKIISCEPKNKLIASKMFSWSQNHIFDHVSENKFETVTKDIINSKYQYHCTFWRISKHQKASIILAIATRIDTKNEQLSVVDNEIFSKWVVSDEAKQINHLLETCLAIDFADDRRLVQQLFQHSTIPTMLLTRKGRVLYANKMFAHLTGYSIKQLTAIQITQTILSNMHNDHSIIELSNAMKAEQSWSGEVDINSLTSGTIQITLCAAPVTNSQGRKRVLIQALDMTSYKEERELLHQLAYFDSTTGLPNRLMLKERLSVANTNARSAGHIGALFFIDLDHFTNIVDVYGHHHGDSVVKYITEKIKSFVGDKGALYRLGGDEIGVLTPRISSKHREAQISSIEMAETIRKMIEQPFTINQIHHYVTASIGAVTFPKALEGTEDLLREADTALHGAKNSGRNCSMLFHTAMYQAIRQKCEIEAGVRQALLAEQFLLYIQPQVNQNAQWISAEILIRWLHPERGMIPPDHFIPVAEDTGQIIQIGHWVLDQSIGFLAELTDAGKPIPISINISAAQIKESTFVQQILDLIDYHQVDPCLVTLEITESLLLSDFQKSNLVMQELSQIGISFSIDDFGTGYSNLNYLRQLPVKELKIDRSFVMQVTENKQDAILVKSLISLGHQLSLEVVAEGVETQEQAKFLIGLACEKMQGYLHSKPISLAQFRTKWLEE
jgi:diguanylate cyclase (GGDEF)-like protein/PAS domain S-box-containing protein